MTDRLRGLSVLVTGASSGIGLAVARLMAASGAWVGMVARTEPALSAAAEQVGGHPFPADISSNDSVEALREHLGGLLGGAPDILVNSTGAFTVAPFAQTDPADFRRMLDGNLQGPFLVIRALLPAMLERGTGHIVNVGSVAGRLAFPGNAAYSASKYGLRGMHDVLAAELAGTGVRSTLIEPAATDTPLWNALDPDSREDLPSRSSMLGAEDVARAILFAIEQPAGVEVSHLAVRSIR